MGGSAQRSHTAASPLGWVLLRRELWELALPLLAAGCLLVWGGVLVSHSPQILNKQRGVQQNIGPAFDRLSRIMWACLDACEAHGDVDACKMIMVMVGGLPLPPPSPGHRLQSLQRMCPRPSPTLAAASLPDDLHRSPGVAACPACFAVAANSPPAARGSCSRRHVWACTCVCVRVCMHGHVVACPRV